MAVPFVSRPQQFFFPVNMSGAGAAAVKIDENLYSRQLGVFGHEAYVFIQLCVCVCVARTCACLTGVARAVKCRGGGGGTVKNRAPRVACLFRGLLSSAGHAIAAVRVKVHEVCFCGADREAVVYLWC